MALQVRVLGNVEAHLDGRVVDLGHPRQRCVLVALLVESNRLVATDQLLDRVWGERAPSRARESLYSYLSRLRQVLSSTGEAELVRRSGGYVLDIDDNAVDLHRFNRLVRQAHESSAADGAVDTLDEALVLWRGPAFADLDTPWLAGVRNSLDRDRRSAELDRNDLALSLGRHSDLLNHLISQVDEHPLDERLAGQLMLALYRCGRQADALNHYERLRQRLADELGGDPSTPLRQQHEAILRGEIAPLPSAQPPPSRLARNDLPGDIADFTGREAELDTLLTAVAQGADAATTAVVIEAIDGMAGVGKTALAVHAAHVLGHRYPDARLFIDLHGHSQDRDATPVHAVLEALLRALGVPQAAIPDDVDQRSALWRAELAGRRVLVVLDNAADSAQVRALLPGTPGCLALVTSRRRLVDLTTTRTVSLDVMPLSDAVALFSSIVGVDRAAAEPDAVAAVVRDCGCLPLAVRLAAARLRSRAQWTVGHLARRLHDGRRRLAELSTGDLEVAVTFDLSYRHLRAEQQRGFRLLGLHPGDDFDAHAVAALVERDPDTAEGLLEDLVDVHLLQQPAPGRYRFHDLLREHARALAGDTDSAADRRDAVARLVDHYLHIAAAADGLISPPGRFRVEPTPSARQRQPVGLPDADGAMAWFEAEHSNLLAAVRLSAEEDWTARCWQLAAQLYRYFHLRGRTEHLRETSEIALAVTVRGGDHHGEAVTRTNLGLALYRSGRFGSAHEQLTLAIPLFGGLEGSRGASQAMAALGNACKKLGRFDEALDWFQRDLALCEQHHRHSEAIALGNLGAFFLDTERYVEAATYFDRTLVVMRETGDRLGESTTLGNLGQLRLELGQFPEALHQLDQALRVCRDISDRHGEARTLTSTGEVYGHLGSHDLALEHHHQALAIIREIGSHSLETAANNGMARSLWHCGRTGDALAQHHRALDLARAVEQPLEEAAALEGIGQCLDRLGDRQSADRAWEQAISILSRLHHPRARVIDTRLAGRA